MNLNNPDTAARQLARAVAILALAGFFCSPVGQRRQHLLLQCGSYAGWKRIGHFPVDLCRR
ncbi:MAG: hypothetical protein HZY76_21040 [Anaerolineae bacterium]|nr:MAG: hypothetical protein HZY76_21040 [Anaerolineae bacterium]